MVIVLKVKFILGSVIFLDLGKLCSQFFCVASFINSRLPFLSNTEIVFLLCLCLKENLRSAPKLTEAMALFPSLDFSSSICPPIPPPQSPSGPRQGGGGSAALGHAAARPGRRGCAAGAAAALGRRVPPGPRGAGAPGRRRGRTGAGAVAGCPGAGLPGAREGPARRGAVSGPGHPAPRLSGLGTGDALGAPCRAACITRCVRCREGRGMLRVRQRSPPKQPRCCHRAATLHSGATRPTGWDPVGGRAPPRASPPRPSTCDGRLPIPGGESR